MARAPGVARTGATTTRGPPSTSRVRRARPRAAPRGAIDAGGTERDRDRHAQGHAEAPEAGPVRGRRRRRRRRRRPSGVASRRVMAARHRRLGVASPRRAPRGAKRSSSGVRGRRLAAQQRVDRGDDEQRHQRRHHQPADHRAPERRVLLAALAQRRAPSAACRGSSPAPSSGPAAAASRRRPARRRARVSAASSARASLAKLTSRIEFETAMPTAMIAPMNDSTFNVVPVSASIHRTPTKLARHRDHDDQRIQQRLEEHDQQQVDQDDRDDHPGAEAAERLGMLSRLAAHRDARRPSAARLSAVDDARMSRGRAAEVASVDRRLHVDDRLDGVVVDRRAVAGRHERATPPRYGAVVAGGPGRWSRLPRARRRRCAPAVAIVANPPRALSPSPAGRRRWPCGERRLDGDDVVHAVPRVQPEVRRGSSCDELSDVSMLFATSRTVMFQLRGLLAIDVQPQRGLVEHLRDADVLASRDLRASARTACARPRRSPAGRAPRPGRRSSPTRRSSAPGSRCRPA